MKYTGDATVAKHATISSLVGIGLCYADQAFSLLSLCYPTVTHTLYSFTNTCRLVSKSACKFIHTNLLAYVFFLNENIELTRCSRLKD